MQDLKINLIQSDLVWEQPEQNLKNFDKKLSGLKGQQHIIALPEMFNTGFTMNGAGFAEEPERNNISMVKD